MERKSKPKPDNPEQSRRFIDAARAAEADETEKARIRLSRRLYQINRNLDRGVQGKIDGDGTNWTGIVPTVACPVHSLDWCSRHNDVAVEAAVRSEQTV
jgi:hypothetical protein